ncbi:hypothetical protein A3224_11630 [Microbulbifer thermotolerans]|uniref:Uncharacterized protein n=1 Tax=Microbulbifer thermotolerans TaxID=252514 RepID=A0A143HNR7_MICTH|nr:hypothetical protein A3224_11630 [Microbulbifer thermotolerans]
MPVGGHAAAGVVFPAQFAVGVLGFDELSEAVVAEAGGAVGGDFLQQAAEGVPLEEGVYAFAGVGVGDGAAADEVAGAVVGVAGGGDFSIIVLWVSLNVLIDPLHWLYLSRNFESCFKSLVGATHSVRNACERLGKRWVHGIRDCTRYFSPPLST